MNVIRQMGILLLSSDRLFPTTSCVFRAFFHALLFGKKTHGAKHIIAYSALNYFDNTCLMHTYFMRFSMRYLVNCHFELDPDLILKINPSALRLRSKLSIRFFLCVSDRFLGKTSLTNLLISIFVKLPCFFIESRPKFHTNYS